MTRQSIRMLLFATIGVPIAVAGGLGWKLTRWSVPYSLGVTRPNDRIGLYTDFDTYLFAVGADLQTYDRIAGRPQNALLAEMSSSALRMMQAGIVWTRAGGWLFQPGGWDNHPDFRFSGYDTLRIGLTPKAAPLSAPDASHFSVFPPFLNSLRLATPDTARAQYYAQLEMGLCRQFLGVVVSPPGAQSRLYRFSNYMDGRNGLYRVNYLGRGTMWGYGPYQLSSTVFNGWWAFLGAPGISNLYSALHAEFPFSEAEIRQLSGPVPAASLFRDGRYALLVSLAARLGGGTAFGDMDREAGDRVWQKSFAPELRTELWRGKLAESAIYTLMVPLHVAFLDNRLSWKRAFADQFRRYTASESSTTQTSLLGRLHYMYLASRFVVLASQSQDEDLIPPGLPDKIEKQIMALWATPGETISQTGWGEPPFHEFRSYEKWKGALAKQYRVSPEISPAPRGAVSGCSSSHVISARPREVQR